METKDLRSGTKQLINRHTRGALRRAEEVATALGLSLHVKVRAEPDMREKWGGRWRLTLRLRLPDGFMVDVADYRFKAEDPLAEAALTVFVTDLSACARRRGESGRGDGG